MIVKKRKKLLVLFLLVMLTPIINFGQVRDTMSIEIIKQLKLVETQKMALIDYNLTLLKYEAKGTDSIRLLELEQILTTDEIQKRVENAFDKFFTKEEIHDIYMFIQTTAYEKMFSSDKLYNAVNSEFIEIYTELEKISKSKYNEERVEFTPIPIDREDGFYSTIDYDPYFADNELILEEKPSLTKDDILKVEKTVNNYKNIYIKITFTEEGKKKFYILTKENIQKPIAIVINKHIVYHPIVQSAISGGAASISGDFTEEEIDEMINSLKQ